MDMPDEYVPSAGPFRHEMPSGSLLSDLEGMVNSNAAMNFLRDKLWNRVDASLDRYSYNICGLSGSFVIQDNGQVFKEVIDTVYDLIKRYDVKMIVTWGPDRGMLKKNFYFCDYDRKRVDEILRLFEDVSFKVSQGYGYKYPISQSKMCEILNVKENGFHHDAYDDALNHSKIV
jgi:inhibitor of KinA sporulation pathway (predicted exonuclease)